MEIEIDFTDKEITPWGGIVLMKKLIEKTGIIETLNKLQLPTQGSNRGYNPIQIIMSFWVSSPRRGAGHQGLSIWKLQDKMK